VTNIFRKAYSAVGLLLLAEYVLQLYLIAAGIFIIAQADDNQRSVYSAFKNAGDNWVGVHAFNGWLIGILIIIYFAISFAARLPRQLIGLTGLLLVLFIVQFFLAHTGLPAVSALHGINALILIGLTGYLTGRTWAFGRRSAPASSRAPIAEASPAPR
jgi:uncharacterized protein DUF6220